MGWPEDPLDWGVPGHINRGDEYEAVRAQIGRLSGPPGGQRWTSGSTLAAGIAGVESLTNMGSGVLFLEEDRLYDIRVKIRLTCTATDTFLFRLRKNSAAGTQVDEWTYTCENASFGWRVYFESDYVPSADEEVEFVLTCQRLSGAGTLTVQAGATTGPTFVKVYHGGHSSDVTTNS